MGPAREDHTKVPVLHYLGWERRLKLRMFLEAVSCSKKLEIAEFVTLVHGVDILRKQYLDLLIILRQIRSG